MSNDIVVQYHIGFICSLFKIKSDVLPSNIVGARKMLHPLIVLINYMLANYQDYIIIKVKTLHIINGFEIKTNHIL